MKQNNEFEAHVASRENAEQHSEEIRKTRIGGLGGSDAAMLLKIGEKGLASLTGTDHKRLAVMLGMAPVDTFGGNVYTNAGHLFEDWVAEVKPWGGANYYEREKYIEQKLAVNYKTFAHADFMSHRGVVIECKFVQAEQEKVLAQYRAQLQWYYMLGAKEVFLLHGQGSADPFVVEENEVCHIERDEQIVNTMLAGVKILDDALTDGWLPSVQEKIAVEETPELVRKAFSDMEAIKAQEAELKARKDAATAVLKDYCEDWGLSGIFSTGETNKQVVYVKASVAKVLDVERLKKEHPEIDYEQYYKENKRSASISFK